MNKKIKTILGVALTFILSLVLVACGGSEDSSTEADGSYSPENPVDVSIGIVGDSDGPGNAQWNIVVDQLAEEGINIELVSLSDYNTPNTSLVAGDLDLNAFQTKIFLEEFNEASGEEVTAIGDTTFNPLGIYSNNYTDASEISGGDQISIPNDPSNGGRALVLLQTAGLIELDPEAGLTPTVDDITANPLNLDIVAIEANQTARSLEDSAAAVINNDIATSAGLIPTEDAIFLEAVDENTEPYVNVIASRPEDTENPVYLRIVEAYQTQEVADAITESTKGSSIPVWTEE